MKRIITLTLIILLLLTTTGFAFTDIQNHWSKETVAWGVEKKVVQGYPDNTFKPNNTVTEAEFLAMLLRAYRINPTSTTSHWADPYYKLAVDTMNYPVAGGQDVSKRSFVITRTQVAEIVAASQNVNYDGKEAIHFLLLKGLAKGRDPQNLTIANYQGEATLTRAEAVQFIKNVIENGNPMIGSRPTNPSPSLGPIGDNDRIIPLVEVKDDKGWVVRSNKSELTAEDKERLATYPQTGYSPKADPAPDAGGGITTIIKMFEAGVDILFYGEPDPTNNIGRKFIHYGDVAYRADVGGVGGMDFLRGIEIVGSMERDVELMTFNGAYITDNPIDRKGRTEIRKVTPLSSWRASK